MLWALVLLAAPAGSPVVHIATAAKAPVAVTVDAKGVATLWDLARGRRGKRIPLPASGSEFDSWVGLSPLGDEMMTGGEGTGPSRWRTRSGKRIRTYAPPPRTRWTAPLRWVGRQPVVNTDRGRFALDLETGAYRVIVEAAPKLASPTLTYGEVVHSPTRRFVAKPSWSTAQPFGGVQGAPTESAVTAQHGFRVWDTRRGRSTLRMTPLFDAYGIELAFNANEDLIVREVEGNYLRLYRHPDWTAGPILQHRFASPAISGDGKLLLLPRSNGMEVYDARTFRLLRRIAA